MQKTIHRAGTRGHANHGWLNSHHSFSFASWYNPERMGFGLLRVLNDDEVAPGMGFGTHPHDNMEIVSIPLSGALEHQDSMGNKTIIRENEVQIMSAGTGVRHSEYNHSKEEGVKFLQIWVFPKARNIAPRYEQRVYRPEDRRNQLLTVVAPDEAGALKINQDAWFSLGDFDAGQSVSYHLHQPGQGAYLFVLEGEVEVAGETLGRRDAIGLWGTAEVAVKAGAKAQFLLIEVPMEATA
ncbi:pirin family protein [Phaeodactylibacter luteus]|uniref:Pirin family protein n=1 Tax=Phaeodactylibacter luteus TaxID=1564516 RepID=A0A5C6RJL3_9BACT|nr:pirin family protein [Phaeodactylibacter luteus]